MDRPRLQGDVGPLRLLGSNGDARNLPPGEIRRVRRERVITRSESCEAVKAVRAGRRAELSRGFVIGQRDICVRNHAAR